MQIGIIGLVTIADQQYRVPARLYMSKTIVGPNN